MDDREFLRQFETLELPFSQWTHRAHVRLAYLYLRAHDFDGALAKVRSGIRAYNERNNIPQGPTSGYNETTTHAFLWVVHCVFETYESVRPTQTSDEFCDAHPQLLNKHVLRLYYSPAQRRHPNALNSFVPPDLAPLPNPRAVSPEHVPWLDRRVHFAVPISDAPLIRVRLEGTPVRMAALLEHIPAKLRTTRVANRWSMQENAGHLLDLEPLWAARVRDILGGAEELTPWEPTNAQTESARHNQRPLTEILDGFRAARSHLLAIVRPLSAADLNRAARHGRLETSLRLLDHLSFVATHDDYHLARICEMRDEHPPGVDLGRVQKEQKRGDG